MVKFDHIFISQYDLQFFFFSISLSQKHMFFKVLDGALFLWTL